ncbi:UDP-glucose 6-dehydrogenase [Candidatus Woesearchaeota archaeon]|nr:MAG: UDP-glucose 6-dehydrogenase [Candidatus Woesearchaeota archaeon]
MKVAIIGTGYVGLTTGACLAEMGHEVTCIDKIKEKIENLKAGKCPIYDPGLPELVETNHREGRLKFTTNLKEGIKEAQLIFICVGTPPKENGEADLTYVEQAVKEIKEYLDHYAVVVQKSTVPVQTAQWIKQQLIEKADVAVNPEFLREGTSVQDFFNPDRIVIGTDTPRANGMLTELYKPLNTPIIHTDLNSAEIIKHASNAFLAMKISYANLVSRLCDKSKADVHTVMAGVGMDKRIGKEFLNAGIGYGGSCFPKDIEAFMATFKQHGEHPGLLEEVKKINEKQIDYVLQLAEQTQNLKNAKVTVLGLAFKPNTDDTRLSQAITLIKKLQAKGAIIKAYDPKATENAKKELTNTEFYDNVYEAIKGTDMIIIATDWPEFKTINLNKVKEQTNKIIDGRNMFDPKRMKALGFEYKCVGRNTQF